MNEKAQHLAQVNERVQHLTQMNKKAQRAFPFTWTGIWIGIKGGRQNKKIYFDAILDFVLYDFQFFSILIIPSKRCLLFCFDVRKLVFRLALKIYDRNHCIRPRIFLIYFRLIGYSEFKASVRLGSGLCPLVVMIRPKYDIFV